MAVSPKEFEEDCYDVLGNIAGITLQEQGICYTYWKGREEHRACPDIVGSYQNRRFVMDCKRYGPGRYIVPDDREKLDRDIKVVRQHLGWGKANVRKIFVTTEGVGTPAIAAGFRVITVGRAGAPHWKTKLTEGFKNAMQ